jgi:lipoprotein-releasing system permease protein
VDISSFIARRIAFNQQKSFSRFIIRLSIVATIISVAAMIITLSFVNGFQETVSNKIFSFSSHIRVEYRQPMKANIAEEVPIEADETLERNIRNLPQVASVHSFATKYAILKTTEEMEGVLLKGFDSSFKFQNLQSFLQPGGRWIEYNDTTYSREIVVSAFTAEQLQMKLNDRVLIYFVRPDGSLRPDRLTIVGIYKTGIEEYDKTFAIGDIKLIRRLNNWEDFEIGGYEIFLNDYNQMGVVSNQIYNMENFPQLWETRTVKQIYPGIFDWLHIINYNGTILIVIVTIIVIINFITCLIILVLERIKMIGTLKAMGASDWFVQKIFLFHSAYITFTGIIVGVALSLGLLWLQAKTGFVKLKEAEYYMDTAAVRVDFAQVAAVVGGTLLLSVLILIIPSFLVRKIQPIKAIRFT